MLIGIYNSATHVSTNNELRRFIHKQALESRLLSLIGHAEMEKEIQRTITKIAQDKTLLEEDTKELIELDENELRKYIDIVVRESRKEHENPK
jgi:type II restriction/modification system DNA methylase subunit YeeA